MDNDDAGYSSVAWDTYSPSSPSGRGNNGNNGGSNALQSSLFVSSEDDDDLPNISASILGNSSSGNAGGNGGAGTGDIMSASSVILPAESSAWADEPLDNDESPYNVNITGSHAGAHNNGSSNHNSTTTTTTSNNGYHHESYNSSSRAFAQEEDDDHIHRSQAPGKSKKKDITRGVSDLTLETASAQLANRVPMELKVLDAHREKEGSSDSFISYKVTTKTTLKTFAAQTTEVRRRFQDFSWLHAALNRDFPAAVVPPLPDKHRMGYVRGDRFGPEFVEKRRASLERFLQKIAVHPILQRSESLRIFLESRDWNSDLSRQRQRRQDDTRLDTIGDVLMNAFVKIKKPDDKFVAMREEVEKLEENLQSLEKLEQRILKRQEELEFDYREFGGSVAGLGNLETGITQQLHRFAHTVASYAKSMNDLSTREEAEFLSQIHENLAYCGSVQNVLKLRDQKQLDFEELSSMLQQHVSDRDKLKNGGRGGSGGGGAGIGGFFQQKMDEIKGVDQENSRQERLRNLAGKITTLQEEVEKSNDISVAFSNEVSKEFEIFQVQKTVDLKQCLLDYTAGRVEFFERGVTLWDQIVPILESIHVDDD